MFFDLISEQNEKYYRQLVPEIYRNFMHFPGAVAVGAAMELAGTEKCEPAGTLITNVAAKNCLTIDFLQVNPDYREQEIGTLLMEQAFSMAKRMDIEKLMIKMPESEAEETDGLDDSRAYFFLRRGFVWTEKTESEWWFPMEAIEDYADLMMGKGAEYIVPLSELSQTQYKSVFELLEKRAENLSVPYEEHAMEKDLSFAYLEDGKPVGFLITESFRDTYYPLVFVDSDNRERPFISLFRRFLIDAAQEGDTDYYIHVILSEEADRRAVRKILKGVSPVGMRILEAEKDSMDSTAAHIQNVMALSEQARKEDEEFPTEFEVVGYEYYGGEVVDLTDS